MPDTTTEEVFNSPQINIPPTFPFILKQYAKAAIRTQPYDLLRWSASYFRALAKGEEPPIKDRLEYPPPDTPSGLSPGYLKVLIKQLGKGGMVTTDQLVERWNGICLAKEPLLEMLAVGQFGETFDWLHFVANLTQTMVLLCNLLSDEPDGGSAMIPLHTFTKLYTFLASLDCGGPDDQDEESEEHRQYTIAEANRGVLPESEDRVHLETFYDAEIKGSLHSSQEMAIEGNNLKMAEPPSTSSAGLHSGLDNGKRSVSLVQQSPVDEPKVTTSISAPSAATTSLKQKASSSKAANGRGDVDEKQVSAEIMSQEYMTKSKRTIHVPGIGAVVDAVQMQAVIDYLEGVSLKQDGMVKPSNIRHFLCPPLEKVPASQKTRV
ncbi:Ropporin-1-like protein [Frankliniella fusca]|uniref:Ropporin-1-like protein n=1 Tax=Frankliniella fusca TaxID=407009 RepID=A0AAE1GRD0_9NEOP|nr:Ropporin-1-like protein [Frankliniella fusca]